VSLELVNWQKIKAQTRAEKIDWQQKLSKRKPCVTFLNQRKSFWRVKWKPDRRMTCKAVREILLIFPMEKLLTLDGAVQEILVKFTTCEGRTSRWIRDRHGFWYRTKKSSFRGSKSILKDPQMLTGSRPMNCIFQLLVSSPEVIVLISSSFGWGRISWQASRHVFNAAEDVYMITTQVSVWLGH
jgi:hypothetical protein